MSAASATGMGSIPACAGEPLQRPLARPPGRVYPRVCGGTIAFHHRQIPHMGLSPRVRGNQGRSRPCAHRQGSIPACAGEPSIGAPSHRARGVYPRVCGGTRLLMLPSLARYGLSPRVRGNLGLLRRQVVSEGSIPACAGEPKKSASVARAFWVYPRVCGGTSIVRSAVTRSPGLSPRVRGNPWMSTRRSSLGRSIPACAGEPPIRSSSISLAMVYPRVCGGTPAAFYRFFVSYSLGLCLSQLA